MKNTCATKAYVHEAAHDLFGVVVQLGVGEADARAVERDPCAPLHPHHKGAHGEDHPQDVHVVGGQVLGAGLAGAAVGRGLLLGQAQGVGIPRRRTKKLCYVCYVSELKISLRLVGSL